ncbi:hypothetical protein MPH_04167, partial [Macrophomina phaseolina MS6]
LREYSTARLLFLRPYKLFNFIPFISLV